MYLDYTVRPWLLFSFGTFKSFLLVWAKIDCTVHVALIKWPIKQFKPVQRSRQQSQRAYTVLIYILLTGGVVLVLERLTVSKPAYWSPWSFSSNKKTLISIFQIHEISWIADLSIGNLSRDIRIIFWLCHCCIQGSENRILFVISCWRKLNKQTCFKSIPPTSVLSANGGQLLTKRKSN